MSITPRTASLFALLVGAILLRWLPHPPNFTPVLAVALFGGAVFSTRWQAFGLPLAIMFVSDLLIGLHGLIPVIYALLLLIVLIGRRLGSRPGFVSVALGATLASLLFFVGSNLAVWLVGGLYPPTATGLLACFTAAIPFYPNTLFSALFYSVLLFGLLRMAEQRFEFLRPATAAGPATS